MFDPTCRACPRLVSFLDGLRQEFPDYHNAPVASFGALRPRLLIVGLAPGMHGANRTGRPFTGDHAGILLYEMLYRYGFANRPESKALNDGLELLDCRISNAVKCLPPENKPLTDEVRRCNPYLAAELAGLEADALILALGKTAHDGVLRALGVRLAAWPFAHGALQLPKGRRLLSSYHCSRYNTQTGRLTPAMFDAVIARCRELLDG
jgi:uracil-DNA glycosylase family 4